MHPCLSQGCSQASASAPALWQDLPCARPAGGREREWQCKELPPRLGWATPREKVISSQELRFLCGCRCLVQT